MKAAPTIIDGATVLLWAATAGITKTGACTFHADGLEQTRFAGLAITQYREDGGVYLFLCDEDWQALNDSLHSDMQEARAFAEILYPGISDRWHALQG